MIYCKYVYTESYKKTANVERPKKILYQYFDYEGDGKPQEGADLSDYGLVFRLFTELQL